MTVFFSLLFNLLPLYALIGLGYFAGRILHVDRQSLGSLAMFIFMPVVVFGFVSDLDFKLSYIGLPIVVYVIQTVLALGFLRLGKAVYGDAQANLMAMCTAMGNTGYFGLPLVMLFFPQDLVAVYIFMNLGILVFEATMGYYIAARGNFDVRTSLIKISRFPSIYAVILGIGVNASGTELPEQFWTYWTHFKGAYVVVGMMIVGAALSSIQKFVFGPRFLALVFAGKFLCWPGLALLFILVDRMFVHAFSADVHNLLIIMSLVPPGANIAAFAAQLNLQPEKAATTILVGTVFALVYIPAVVMVMGL